MKVTLLLASFLLLPACSRRDSKLHEQMIGTWTRGETFEMRLAADGTYVSQWSGRTARVTFEGTWNVRDSVMVAKLTNCVAQGTTNFPAIGSVDRCAIIRADQTDLVYSNFEQGQTISLKRKR